MKRSIRIFASILFCLVLYASPGLPQEFKANVSIVRDGDTIEVAGPRKMEIIRIADIDCPEMGQSFGFKAKQFTALLTMNKEVIIRPIGKDKYGRIIAEVFINGKSLGEELVRNGLAWWFEQFSKNLALKNMEAEARLRKIGLWVEAAQIPPWDWRHSEQAKKSGHAVYIDDERNASEGHPVAIGGTMSEGKTIHTGPKGGQYYINKSGRKTYVPRK